MSIYHRSKSTREQGERFDESEVLAPTAADDDYYRSKARREHHIAPPSRHHRREEAAPTDIMYSDEGTSRHADGRSSYGDERWVPREQTAPSNHSGYPKASYDRARPETTTRRPVEDPYRSTQYPDDAWPPPHRSVKERDDYPPSSSANYASWEPPPAYPPVQDYSDRSRHSQHTHSRTQANSHSHRSYDWREEDRAESSQSVDRRPGWTQRSGDRAWTRDDGQSGRDRTNSKSSGRRRWEPRSSNAEGNGSTDPTSQPKFAPGPRWKESTGGAETSTSVSDPLKGKGRYERKKDTKDKDPPSGQGSKSTPSGNRSRDDGRRHNTKSSRSDRKSHKRRRSTSVSSQSRSRTESPPARSHGGQSTTDSQQKRKRKSSLSPDRSPRKSRTERTPSPKRRRDDSRGRDGHRGSSQYTRSPSRSRSRHRSHTPSRSRSPEPERVKSQKEDRRTKHRRQSRSFSRSPSPPSSPRASIKLNNGVNATSKHRLPPSGPRTIDLNNITVQPVASKLALASSLSNTAIAYQRRHLGGEPPPGPRAEQAKFGAVPKGPKGMYPPPNPTTSPSQPLQRDPTAPKWKPVASFTSVASNADRLGRQDGSHPARTDEPQSDTGWARVETPKSQSKRSSGPSQSPLGIYPPPLDRPAPDETPQPLPAANHDSRIRLSNDGPEQESPMHANAVASLPPDFPDVRSLPAASVELYQFVNQVGEGTFGKVYKAKNMMTGVLVALKRIKIEAKNDGFPVTALREIKLLQSLSHPNIIYLHEMMMSRGNVYMVLDYMEHDLTGVLSQSQFAFSQSNLKSLCHQMLGGLAYLHHRGIIHRDMKGSNILVNKQGELKLADFGLARVFEKRKKNDYTNRVITIWYRPPELLLGTTVYGPAVDMWSAGTIMLELFTKKAIFQGNDEIQQLEAIYRIMGTPTTDVWPGLTDMPWYELIKPTEIHSNRFRAEYEKYLSPAALDLAEKLLAYDPDSRITAADALNAPYFLTEAPDMELPTGLASINGEWHELETRRERDRRRRPRRGEAVPASGHDQSASATGSGTVTG